MAKIELSDDKFRGAFKVYAKLHGANGAKDLIGTHSVADDNNGYVAELGDGTTFRAYTEKDLRAQIESHIFG